MFRYGGQTLHEMSESQLKNLLPQFKDKPDVEAEILRVLQIKARCRRSDAKAKYQADEDFISNNF